MSSKRDRHSTRPTRAARRSRHKPRRPSAKLPDLQAIFDAFAEAFSLIRAAHMALQKADQWGPPEVTLSKGIEALKAVYSDLDEATSDLVRFQRKQAKAAGRRS